MGGGRRVEFCERLSGAEAGAQNRVEPINDGGNGV
jgi:hypothetical protein